MTKLHALTFLVLAACTSAPTEVMVVVRETAPLGLSSVRISVDGFAEQDASAEAIVSELPLPRTLALRASNGGGTIRVSVEGLRNGVAVVRRHTRVRFAPGETKRLDLWLSSACEATSCAAGTACDRGACVEELVDAGVLPSWDGIVETDAETPPSDAAIDGADATLNDAAGADATTCSCPASLPTNAIASFCEGAICTLTCAPSAGNCDRNIANGCEQLFGTRQYCDGCVPCAEPTSYETSRVCVPNVMRPSRFECAVACAQGRGNCDAQAGNGCEANLNELEAHCGACGNRCAQNQQCRNGRCQ